MSAFSGIVQWQQRPVAAAAVRRLLQHSRVGVPDERCATASPEPWVALQACVFPFDRLSAAETQPYPFGQGHWLTWDGRLDNREDLILTLHDRLGEDLSDAALSAAAYARWGTECVTRLVGDWSLAIWDARTRTVLLARDYMGGRPLFYRATSDGLAWASRLEALVDCFDLYSQPDDIYIAGSLSRGAPRDVTPYVSVHRLRGGHVLVGTAAGVAVRRYWTFTPATLRYADPGQYSDHLRTLLTEAVRVRLRSDRPVWCHLSGGWDSSSVTCLAHRLVTRGVVEAPRIQPLSLVHDGEWSDADERPFMAQIERWCGLQRVEVPFRGFDPIETLRGQPVPHDSAARLFDMFEQRVIDAGDRVLLTGNYGDHVMRHNNAQGAIAERLHEGHPWEFLKLCAARARQRHMPFLTTLTRLVRDVYLSRLTPVQPRTIERSRLAATPAFTVPRSATEGPLRLGDEAPPSGAAFPPAKRLFIRLFYDMVDETGNWGRPLALYRSHPYLHRPLVEFMIAAPGLAFWRPDGSMRHGMRHALADVLPPEMLARQTKMMSGSEVARSKRNQVDELALLGPIPTWQLVQRGHVDAEALTTAVAKFRTEGGFHSTFSVKFIYLEAWLQTLATFAQGRASAYQEAPPRPPEPVAGAVHR